MTQGGNEGSSLDLLLAGQMPQRYLRNEATIGVKGQLKLLQAKVAVDGAGAGLGAGLGLAAASAGATLAWSAAFLLALRLGAGAAFFFKSAAGLSAAAGVLSAAC